MTRCFGGGISQWLESSKSGGKKILMAATCSTAKSKQSFVNLGSYGGKDKTNKLSGLTDEEVIPAAIYEPVNDVDAEISENGSEDS
jgi:hypothetical protein